MPAYPNQLLQATGPIVPPEALDLSDEELASLREFTFWSECRPTVAVYNKTLYFLSEMA